MILPYGHERTTVRRLPWVTFAIMALCALVFLVSLPATGRGAGRVESSAREALEYFFAHPYLELPGGLRRLLLREVEEEKLEEVLRLARRQSRRPSDPRVLEREQERLEELARELEASIGSLPFFRWGLIPAQMRPHELVTYQFLHGGWLHLIGNMFLLFVVGPFIEDVWGRPLFAGFYLAAGVVAAAFYALRYPDLEIPLIGASGAVAGVMAAFGIRYWRTKVRFVLWLGVPLGRFSAPALAVFPMWFVWEFVMARSMDAANPQAGGGGVAHWAHVAGFGFGAAAALALRHYRIEERFIDRAIESKITLVENTALERALAERAAGRPEEAERILSEALRAEPDNPDLAVALWDLAVEQGRTAEAAPALTGVVRRALRDGEADLARGYWQEILDRAPAATLDPATAARMVDLLIEDGRTSAAAETVERVVAQGLEGVPGGALARLARTAALLAAPSSPRLLAAALASPDLPPDAHAELLRLQPPAAVGREPGSPPDAAGGYGRESAPPETGIPVAGGVPTLRVVEAIPRTVSETAVELEAGERVRVLLLEEVQAVAVAGIRRAGERPYLLIDLFLDPPWGSREVRVVRLLGSTFDPRRVVGGDEAIGAFRALIAALLEGSGGMPLPDPERARGNPFQVFESLEDYERELLGAGASR